MGSLQSQTEQTAIFRVASSRNSHPPAKSSTVIGAVAADRLFCAFSLMPASQSKTSRLSVIDVADNFIATPVPQANRHLSGLNTEPNYWVPALFAPQTDLRYTRGAVVSWGFVASRLRTLTRLGFPTGGRISTVLEDDTRLASLSSHLAVAEYLTGDLQAVRQRCVQVGSGLSSARTLILMSRSGFAK